jgi:hypothetical protein
MNIITEDQDLPIPLTVHLRSERAIQTIPLLATLGITAAMGTGAAGIGTYVHYYYTKLSNRLISDLQTVAESILTLQKQLESIASVVLQTDKALTCSLQRRVVSAYFYKSAASMLTSWG